jgi:hypothetical protein
MNDLLQGERKEDEKKGVDKVICRTIVPSGYLRMTTTP